MLKWQAAANSQHVLNFFELERIHEFFESFIFFSKYATAQRRRHLLSFFSSFFALIFLLLDQMVLHSKFHPAMCLSPPQRSETSLLFPTNLTVLRKYFESARIFRGMKHSLTPQKIKSMAQVCCYAAHMRTFTPHTHTHTRTRTHKKKRRAIIYMTDLVTTAPKR